MRRPIRLTTVLMLLVALVVTGLVPAAGSWSCPDGTACVFTEGRGFHCLGDECRIACCADEKPQRGCGRCDHGALPGAKAPTDGSRHAVGEADQCLYREAQQLQPAWVTAAAPDLQWHVVAVLPLPVQAPVVIGCFVPFAPIRGSPPSRSSTPPSAPRAPPGADCA